MSAYTHFHRDSSNAFSIKDPQYIVDQHNQLSEPQLEFLNPGSCQYVNPYSKTFWQDMKDWLSPISNQAARYPKSEAYRDALEPYLLREVTMTARSWRILDIDAFSGQLRLVLEDVRLSHVYSSSVGAAPGTIVDHMNVWVSPSWLHHVDPDPSEPLIINGVLYEYVSKGIRNISVLPVLLAPRSREIRRGQDHRSIRPDILECPGVPT